MLSSVLAVPWSRKRDERATVEYDGKSKIKVFLLFGASSVGWVRRHLIQVDYKGSSSSSPDTLSAIFPTIPFFFAFACWESEDKEAMTRAMAHRRTILHRGIIFSFFFPYTSWGDNVLRGKKNSNITNHSRKCEYKHATTMLCTRLECWVSNKDALWCRLTAKFGDQQISGRPCGSSLDDLALRRRRYIFKAARSFASRRKSSSSKRERFLGKTKRRQPKVIWIRTVIGESETVVEKRRINRFLIFFAEYSEILYN